MQASPVADLPMLNVREIKHTHTKDATVDFGFNFHCSNTHAISDKMQVNSNATAI